MRPVVYVSDGYPKLAQTFTLRDVRALEGAGLVDRVISLHRPSPEDPPVDPQADPRIDYLPHPLSPRVLASWLACCIRHPIEMIRICFRALAPHTSPWSWRWQIRAPLHVLWGAEVARRFAPARPHFHAQFVGSASTVAWVASRLGGGSFSMTAHADWGLPLVGPKMRESSFVISVSEVEKARLLAHAPGVPPEHVIVCRVGVELDAPRPATPSRGRLVAVGTIGPTKGHDVLVRACALVRDRGTSFRLDLVGGGAGLDALRALVAELHLGDHVVLHGALQHAQARALVRDADIVVLACRVTERGDCDGIPVALMEGMAAGKATVSTPVGAIAELIEDGVSGRLVPPDRPDALADALIEILGDAGIRQRLGVGGWRRVAERFEIGKTSRALVETFQGRLGSRAAAPGASA